MTSCFANYNTILFVFFYNTTTMSKAGDFLNCLTASETQLADGSLAKRDAANLAKFRNAREDYRNDMARAKANSKSPFAFSMKRLDFKDALGTVWGKIKSRSNEEMMKGLVAKIKTDYAALQKEVIDHNAHATQVYEKDMGLTNSTIVQLETKMAELQQRADALKILVDTMKKHMEEFTHDESLGVKTEE